MSRLLSLSYALAPHLSVRPFALSHDRTGYKMQKMASYGCRTLYDMNQTWMYSSLENTLLLLAILERGDETRNANSHSCAGENGKLCSVLFLQSFL